LLLLAAAAFMSTGGAAVKSATLTGLQIASLRSVIGALVLLAVTPARRGLGDRRAMLVGLAIGAVMVLFVTANKLTTAANTIFLQYAAPLYVLIAAPRLLGERLEARDMPHVAALAIGVGLFFADPQQPSATAPDPRLGNVLAALSGVLWAAVIMGLRWLASRSTAPGTAEAAAVYGNLVAFTAGLPWVLAQPAAIPQNVAVITYLGVAQIGLSYLLLSAGLRFVPAPEASLLLLVEPALNPVWALLLHGERPGGWALTGGALILGSTALRTAMEARRRRAQL
jgi:drug/metabolite transporter (DMT)-like permease